MRYLSIILFLISFNLLSYSPFSDTIYEVSEDGVTADYTTATKTLNSRAMDVSFELIIGDYVSGDFDVRIEHSQDGTHWYPAVDFVTTTATNELLYPSDSILGKVRANVGVTGTGTASLTIRAHYGQKR